MQSSKNILTTANGTTILQTAMKSNNNTSINSTTLNNIHPRPTINPLQHQLLQQQQSISIATQQQQNISITAQQPQQITRTPTSQIQIPSDCVVIKNEHGQLMLVQQSNNNRNPLLCNNILPLQQSTASQRNINSLMQNSVIGSLSSNTSSVPPTNTRQIFIQNQNLQQQQQLQRVTILPAQQQQQLNRLLPNQTNNYTNNNTTSHVTIVATPTTRPSISNTIQSDQQPNDQKEVIEDVMKCKNFLSTLLKLASNQPTDTLNRVMKLIQGLIDDVVTPEEFTSQLQKLLKSSPQPYLIPFLNKSLPYLRKFMIKNKSMEIDGIKPPKVHTNNNFNNNFNTSNNLNTNNNIGFTSSTLTATTTTTNNSQTIPFSNLKPVMRAGQQANILNNQHIFHQHQLQQQHQLRKSTKISLANSTTSTLTTNSNNTSTNITNTNIINNNINRNNNITNTNIINNNNNIIRNTNNNTGTNIINNNNIIRNNSTNNITNTNIINNNNIIRNTNNNILSSSDNHLVNMVATTSTANLETFKQNLQQQQQSVMAALHTSKNFIAPTTPLPSSLPRLILSSNSTLLTSIHNQSHFNNHTISKLSTNASLVSHLSTPINSTTTNNLQLSGNNNMAGLNNSLMQQQHNKLNKMPSMLLKNSSTDLQQGAKRKFDCIRDDNNDDINDVAAMGGVNITEETRNFSNPLLISGQTFGQTRSFNDDIPQWESQLLQALVNKIAQKKGLTHVHPDCVKLLSQAVKYKLRDILEQLSVIAEHRSEIYKNEKQLETCSEVKRQLKFRQELAKMEDDKAKEVKNIALMKAAKSRTKTDDPDQLKRKELAKKQQQEDMDAKRKEQSDLTALAAIGSKKKLNLSQRLSLMNGHSQSLSNPGNISLFNISGLSRAGQILSQRSRRANLKDLLHVLQWDKHHNRSAILYKTFLKY